MSDAAIQLGESTVKLLAELDRLRAENEKLKAQLIEYHANASKTFFDQKAELDRLQAECETLRAENEGYKQAMRANNMTADAQYLERHLREACLALGGAACRDGLPMGEGLIREIENLRATALTASEAEAILVPNTRVVDPEAVSAWVKVRKIAHPEPQEGSNG